MKNKLLSSPFNLIVFVSALGYFVDIYDLILFGMVRIPSLNSLGIHEPQALLDYGLRLMNFQMAGMLLGGIVWGVLGDKIGRVSMLFFTIFIYSSATFANAFITSINSYIALRFISGFGLAGEIGIAMTLVCETMSNNNRGYGTMIVAAFGMVGAIAAGLIAEYSTWQSAYMVGGILGFLLLLLRLKVKESVLFTKALEKPISRGNVWLLFNTPQRLKKTIACLLLGGPIWYLVGIVVMYAPEYALVQGIQNIKASTALMVCYSGICVGDILSSTFSQLFCARRSVIFSYLVLGLAATGLFLYHPISHTNHFYIHCFFIGFAGGYWAIFLTTAAEQFGTNLRSTIANITPNVARGLLIPLTMGFQFLRYHCHYHILHAAFILGVVCIGIALIATLLLEETFGKDLDFIEESS